MPTLGGLPFNIALPSSCLQEEASLRAIRSAEVPVTAEFLTAEMLPPPREEDDEEEDGAPQARKQPPHTMGQVDYALGGLERRLSRPVVGRVLSLLACSAAPQGLSRRALLDCLSCCDDLLGFPGMLGPSIFRAPNDGSAPPAPRRFPAELLDSVLSALGGAVVVAPAAEGNEGPSVALAAGAAVGAVRRRYLGTQSARRFACGLLADYFCGVLARAFPQRGIVPHHPLGGAEEEALRGPYGGSAAVLIELAPALAGAGPERHPQLVAALTDLRYVAAKAAQSMLPQLRQELAGALSAAGTQLASAQLRALQHRGEDDGWQIRRASSAKAGGTLGSSGGYRSGGASSEDEEGEVGPDRHALAVRAAARLIDPQIAAHEAEAQRQLAQRRRRLIEYRSFVERRRDQLTSSEGDAEGAGAESWLARVLALAAEEPAGSAPEVDARRMGSGVAERSKHAGMDVQCLASVAAIQDDNDGAATQSQEGSVVCLSPDGVRVFTAVAGAVAELSRARIWHALTGETVCALAGLRAEEDGAVTCACFSASAAQCAAGTSTGQVAVWDCGSGARTFVTWERLAAPITSVAFSPRLSAPVIIARAANGAARILDVAKGAALATVADPATSVVERRVAAAWFSLHGGHVACLLADCQRPSKPRWQLELWDTTAWIDVKSLRSQLDAAKACQAMREHQPPTPGIVALKLEGPVAPARILAGCHILHISLSPLISSP